MSIEKERERGIFEPLQNQMALARLYFVKELNMYLTSDDYADDDFTISLCMEINHGWKMWQASANRQGYKLVPVDLIERCISHIGIASCHPANSLHDDQQMEVDIDALEKAMIGVCE